jgi:hypothetical protein
MDPSIVSVHREGTMSKNGEGSHLQAGTLAISTVYGDKAGD